MPLFLETYTIPHDLPAQDLIYGLRKVNRGTDVRMLRCAYSMREGRAWCVTEAPSEVAVRNASLSMQFAFTLDNVARVDSPDAIDRIANLEGRFECDLAQPKAVGNRKSAVG
jgi:hypothetical protein